VSEHTSGPVFLQMIRCRVNNLESVLIEVDSVEEPIRAIPEMHMAYRDSNGFWTVPLARNRTTLSE